MKTKSYFLIPPQSRFVRLAWRHPLLLFLVALSPLIVLIGLVVFHAVAAPSETVEALALLTIVVGTLAAADILCPVGESANPLHAEDDQEDLPGHVEKDQNVNHEQMPANMRE